MLNFSSYKFDVTGLFRMGNDYSAGWFTPMVMVFVWVIMFFILYYSGTKQALTISSFLAFILASLLAWGQLLTP